MNPLSMMNPQFAGMNPFQNPGGALSALGQTKQSHIEYNSKSQMPLNMGNDPSINNQLDSNDIENHEDEAEIGQKFLEKELGTPALNYTGHGEDDINDRKRI